MAGWRGAQSDEKGEQCVKSCTTLKEENKLKCQLVLQKLQVKIGGWRGAQISQKFEQNLKRANVTKVNKGDQRCAITKCTNYLNDTGERIGKCTR